MVTFYEYFIASLPLLNFTGKAPLSCPQFIERAKDFISEVDACVLNKVLHADELATGCLCPTFAQWIDFNRRLRNEVVKIRASRKHVDPLKYLRGDSFSDGWLAHAVSAAHRNPSLIEAERQLDGLRWQFLEELEAGHYFDLDVLVVYLLKLRILERWAMADTVEKEKLLEGALS